MQPAELLTGDQVWLRLTAKCKATKRHHVAVAYLGGRAQDLLPLKSGDTLIVDASDKNLEAGVIDPASLAEYHSLGVLLYSRKDLHAKVFVLGSTAFIGSANVSASSAGRLMEAMVVTADAGVVAEATQFIDALARDSKRIDEDFIARAKKRWRPPPSVGRPPPPPPIPTTPFRLFLIEGAQLTPSAADQKLRDEAEAHGRVPLVPDRFRTMCHYLTEPSLHLDDVIITGADLATDHASVHPPEVVTHIERVGGRWPHDLVFTRVGVGLPFFWLDQPRLRNVSRKPGAGCWELRRGPDRPRLVGLWWSKDPGPP